MKCLRKRRGRYRWVWALSVEWLVMTACAGGVALILLTYGALYDVYLWLVYPLVGAWAAYKAVRWGLNAYIAWLAAPIALPLVHYAVLGYLPAHFGMVLLAAFVALIGAAAGDVRNIRSEKNNAKPRNVRERKT